MKAAHDSEPHKIRGVAGSDPYIAPEQWTSEEYDALAADVWSFGTVLMIFIIRHFILLHAN